MKLALLVLVAACSRSPAQPEPPPPLVGENLPQFGPDPLATANELVLGIVDTWDSTKATLRRYRRVEPARTWVRSGLAWPAVVGKTGIAWGNGLHGDGAPNQLAGPLKREGDGKSPAGMFRIAKSYGYAAQPPDGTQLPYVPATDYQCVDDPASQHYATIVRPGNVTVDWTSHEVMRRPDELYEWVIDIAHNAARVPGKGSCIFFHVWRGEDGSTLGCTAMAEPKLRELVATLDPSTIFVLLTRDAYEQLKAAWQLPAL